MRWGELFRREPLLADAEFGDPVARVEVVPVRQREIRNLARIVGPVGELQFLAGDIDRTQSPLVLQHADIGQRRPVEQLAYQDTWGKQI